MKRNIRGETPLHLACIKGDLVHVQELLQKGSDPNVKDHAGWTPLHEACNHGFVDIVAALLDNGALINMPGLDNDSPLHDAVASNRPNIVKLLIERGASLDVRNIHGNTPKDLPSSEEVMNALKTKPGVTSDLNTSFTSSISSSPASSQKIVLLGTGLNDKQRNKLQSCARLLRGKVTSDFTQNITHLVANAAAEGRCSRTMKFLQAVLLGKWVVNFSWVEECLKGKGLVPEVNHEICGTMIDSDSEGARKSREMANSQFPPLFDGCHFYIHGNFSPPTPPKEELASLLKLGGGTILTRYQSQMMMSSRHPNSAIPCQTRVRLGLVFILHHLRYRSQTKKHPAQSEDRQALHRTRLMGHGLYFEIRTARIAILRERKPPSSLNCNFILPYQLYISSR
ncbi:putative BRCA1-associated RING domain protein 1-like [Apostichopus japonicus]|uniref:Putative BRCA1-associated RING domain protein 1-like n=1 Tax=Stichopus japonicus TaxID=307972 RepID=A0A2G8LL56_STIJA|nr:putative BRCA1-associated RING domain protein 1-like [Apostichopus japonicus]